jgi:hypothetical protein
MSSNKFPFGSNVAIVALLMNSGPSMLTNLPWPLFPQPKVRLVSPEVPRLSGPPAAARAMLSTRTTSRR